MVDLKHIKNIYLYASPISLTLGIPSLTNLIEANYTDDQKMNSLFVFFGNNKSQIKIIEFDSSGTWLYQKRLKEANFQFPQYEENAKIDKRQLLAILNSLKPKKIRNNTKKD
jgi:transposase